MSEQASFSFDVTTAPVDKLSREDAVLELARLVDAIAHHDRLYYQNDAPDISEAEYDKLRQRNEAIEARFPDLVRDDSPSQKVGAAPARGFAKVKHAVPMLSLGNAFSDEDDAKLGREHRGEVVLKKFLLPALEKLNPELTKETLDQAIAELTRGRSQMTLVNANHEVYKLLHDGASVDVPDDNDEHKNEQVRFFDFDSPEIVNHEVEIITNYLLKNRGVASSFF